MAFRQFVTATPTAISGMTDGVVYVVQLLGGGAAFIENASSAPPTDSETANVMDSKDAFLARNESGDDTYIWVNVPADGQRVVVNERIG